METQHVTKASCGQAHSVAVTDTGQVYSWGCNLHGQLGIGATDAPFSNQPKYVVNVTLLK